MMKNNKCSLYATWSIKNKNNLTPHLENFIVTI